MMLFAPDPTPYDLHFRLYDIRVRVHPFFWLICAVTGWDYVNQPGQGLLYLLAWAACVFVSILWHELGHVLMGRVFGAWGYIVLYSFGGLAIGSSDVRGWWRRVLVYLAGPGSQLLLWLGLLALVPYVKSLAPQARPLAAEVLRQMVYINLWWAVLNLLPIWPLDGGQVTRETLRRFDPIRGVRIALWISVVLAGALAVNALSAMYDGPTIPWLYAGGPMALILFGLLAIGSFMELRQERAAWNESSWTWRDRR